MKKVIHIITGLGSGGAENMLHKLLKYSDKELYYHEIISLVDEGVMGERIKAEGITIHSLNLSGKNFLKSLIKARRICKEFDIVNTWLYHADLFGVITAKILLNKKLIWNIRHSNLDKEANKGSTLRIIKLNSLLSRFVDCITYNSNSAFETHKKIGFIDKDSQIIPNGFELDKFNFNLYDRIRIRKDLSINEEEKVIITVGRWNIQKDYFTLLRALNELKKLNVRFKMIMIGTNLDYLNNDLSDLIDQYDLKENVILLGRRVDIPALLSSADIYVSSSLGESFSNAIGEAMACGLPCVVTDVGDSRDIVGKSGLIVEKQNYMILSKALMELLRTNDLTNYKISARNRVEAKYSIKNVVKEYETILKGIV